MKYQATNHAIFARNIMNRSLLILLPLFIVSQLHAQDPNPRILVEMEHRFRDAVKEKGIRDGFLDYLADSSIVFAPEPVDGKTRFASRPTSPAVLAWEPEFAKLSLSGDLGFTTGAWNWRKTASDTPSAFGTYATVWKKQMDGSWKAQVDAGVDHPKVGEDLLMYVVAGVETLSVREEWSPLNRAQERAMMDPLDLRWSGAAGLREKKKQASGFLHPEIRVIRGGIPPPAGREAAMKYYLSSGGAEFIPAGAGVARAQDLGYTYGEYRVHPKLPTASTIERGSYLHIWKKEKREWLLILDLTNEKK